MRNHTIIKADPEVYREDILNFWEEYLPGTSAGRLDWMNSGNPAGPAVWFLAFEEETGKLTGTISVMPKDFSYKGGKIRAGIMGDFMVLKTNRVFGPGLMLPKTVVSHMEELGFDFLYSMPNRESKKVIEKSGLAECLTLRHLVKPVSTEHYIRKYVFSIPACFFAPLSDAVITFISALVVPFGKGILCEENKADESFDVLWKRIQGKAQGLVGECGSRYLNWRYFKNPQNDFRLITCRREQNDLRGYTFYAVEAGKLEIYDIVALDGISVRSMLKELTVRAKKEGCHGIGIRITDHNPFLPWLRGFLFLDAKDDSHVFAKTSGTDIDCNTWGFLSGDRNM